MLAMTLVHILNIFNLFKLQVKGDGGGTLAVLIIREEHFILFKELSFHPLNNPKQSLVSILQLTEV